MSDGGSPWKWRKPKKAACTESVMEATIRGAGGEIKREVDSKSLRLTGERVERAP